MDKDFKVGAKVTISLKTVVDGKGIAFTPEGSVIIVQGVIYDEEKVFAEILEVHEKTIIARKVVGVGGTAPPLPNAGNGYEADDAHEDDYEEDDEAPDRGED